MMRVAFDKCFAYTAGNELMAKVPVQIAGIVMDEGMKLDATGISFGDMRFSELRSRDLIVKKDHNVYIIQGYYN